MESERKKSLLYVESRAEWAILVSIASDCLILTCSYDSRGSPRSLTNRLGEHVRHLLGSPDDASLSRVLQLMTMMNGTVGREHRH